MKVGIIAPTSLLDECCNLTKVQYILPRLLVEDKTYRYFYMLLKKSNKHLIIMDSKKPGWKREPEDPLIVMEAMKYMYPDLVILPSRMFDYPGTVKIALEFLELVKPSFVSGCLEGTSEKDVESCKIQFSKAGVNTIAIPSHLYTFYKGEEVPNSNKIYIENHSKVEELKGLNGFLVTSLPVRLGLDGRLLSDPLPSPQGLTYNEKPKFTEVVQKNILDTLAIYNEYD